jgi:putative glutamine amidotransferase
MRRPVIAYTIELEDPLLKATEAALREPLQRLGAVTVVVPRSTPPEHIEQVLDLVDGVQLCGGKDVDPTHYGHERHELTRPGRPDQDVLEIELARGALARGMPVLGICRGIQVLAVAAGGELTQDVETLHPGAHRHRYPWQELAQLEPGDHWHDVDVVQGSAAQRWFDGGPARVNSFHHQCVASPGPMLAATVRARDGVIEAVERADGGGFAAGTQWHNEFQWGHDERFLRPFEDLVEAARVYAAAREPVSG